MYEEDNTQKKDSDEDIYDQKLEFIHKIMPDDFKIDHGKMESENYIDCGFDYIKYLLKFITLILFII